MAKKRKVARSRKASRPKAGAKPRRRAKSGENEAMQIAVALLVIALIVFGVYYYQVDVKPMNAPMNASMNAPSTTAMAPAPAAPMTPVAPAAPTAPAPAAK